MFDLFAMGTQVNPSGPDDVGVSPKDTSEPAPHDMLPVDEASRPQLQHDHQQQQPAESQARTSVDSLACKLSTQHIQHEDMATSAATTTITLAIVAAPPVAPPAASAASVVTAPVVTTQAPAPAPAIETIEAAEPIVAATPADFLPHELPLPQSPTLSMSDAAPVPPCPELEMGQRLSSTSSDEPEPASAPISPSPTPIVVDEIPLSHSPPPLEPPQLLPPKPARHLNLYHHHHQPYHGGGGATSSTTPTLTPTPTPRSIETLVEGMISSRDQCNVYQPPPLAIPNYIEPDENIAGMDLEVDESEFYDPVFLDSMPSLRRASGPGLGRIRKHGLLRFRTSADIALSCANVVRSKPRMRRRRKPMSSVPSSAAPSAPASPAPSLSYPATTTTTRPDGT